ncbi:MAG: hypothetical protein ACFNLP_07320, partial [Segatella oulorum]
MSASECRKNPFLADDNPPKYGSIAANRAVTVTTPQNKYVPNSLQKLFGTCCFLRKPDFIVPRLGRDYSIISMRLQGKTVEIAAQYRRFYRGTQKRATVKGRCMWLERVLQEVTL